MIKEALQWLQKETQTQVHKVHELPYCDKGLNLIIPPQPCEVEVETLGALVSLVESGMDGLHPEDSFAQVENHCSVSLLALNADNYGRRRSFVGATISDSCPFQFGRFMDPELFVIALQSMFVEDSQLKGLLALAQNLTAESVVIAEDDGISQKATVRQGVSLKTTRKIEPKVKLAPFRTFREVEQPASSFLFRLRSRQDMPPECALFEADGGAWKLEAVKNISDFLSAELPKSVKVIF